MLPVKIFWLEASCTGVSIRKPNGGEAPATWRYEKAIMVEAVRRSQININCVYLTSTSSDLALTIFRELVPVRHEAVKVRNKADGRPGKQRWRPIRSFCT